MDKTETFSLPTQAPPDFQTLLGPDNFYIPAGKDQSASALSSATRPVKDFVQAAVYTGVAEPVLGLAQIGGAIGSQECKKLPDQLAKIGLKAPERPTSALCQHTQMLGSAVGMMLPYLALHGAMRGTAAKIFGEQAVARGAELELATKSRFAATTAKEAGLSFATGFTYDSVFRVSADSKDGSSLAKTRLLNGVTGGTTMAVLTTASFGIGRVAQTDVLRNTWVKTALTNPMAGGVLSAVPAGLAQSEMTALRKGQALPAAAEVKRNVYQMAFVGFTLGGAHALGATDKGLTPTELTPEEKAVVQQTKAQAFREEPVINMESPAQRADRLHLPTNFELSKELLFGQVKLPDGNISDVVIRSFDRGANSAMRVYRANISEQVGETIKANTGVESTAMPAVIRDNFPMPNMSSETTEFDWNQTTNERVIVQENGGTQLGGVLRAWAIKANGADKNGEPPVGSFTRLINENTHVRSLMGRAAFDNMFKGNYDLVEYSQQTIQEGIHQTELEPSQDLHMAAIDNKNDFTTLDKTTWGFGSQFGMTMEVAKALEGKSLAEVDPTLHTDAQKLLQFFTSSEGQAKLVENGLTEAEVQAAGKRLALLVEKGFPSHLGTEKYYADEAKTQLTASLTTEYDAEAEKMREYVGGRDKNLIVTTIGGRTVVLRGEEAKPAEAAKPD